MVTNRTQRVSNRKPNARSNWSQGGSITGRTTGRTTGTTSGTASGIAPGYRQVNNMFNNKVQSYRTLCEQTKGPSSKNRPSPAALKSFSNWINKGAVVCKITNAQINRWCQTNTPVKSATAAKTVLCSRFGKSAIKAVTFGKSGFIVACAPTVNGKTFKFPK